MARISVLLAMLLIVLTFNAYACILPLAHSAAMDCSSEMEEPTRGICEAFLEIGPYSQGSSTNTIFIFHLASVWPVPLLPDTFVQLVRVTTPPWRTDTLIHCSIQTTVLRI